MKILEKGEKAIEDLQFKAEAYFIPGKILHYPFYFYIFEFYFTYKYPLRPIFFFRDEI